MKPKLCYTILLWILPVCSILAQERTNVKFGDVTEKDFAVKTYAIDSNASAVVIADIGSSSIEGNTKGWFSIASKHFKRAHILNKNGFELADISIPLYSDGTYEEKLDKIRAVTYNLENGKVVETKLDPKTGVFEDKVSKKRKIKKFTLPNVKEGSIIEFEYSTTSDFIEYLDPWEFQGSYPRLWSEYSIIVPNFFHYIFLTQGYLRFDENEESQGRTTYNVTVSNDFGPSDHVSMDAYYTNYKWGVKNVPALKEESFTSTIDNHIQKIDFLLVEQRDPLKSHRYVESWPQITKELLESEYFGQQLAKGNDWLNETLSPITKGINSKSEKAKKIYEYVRDNFTCTRHQGIMMSDQGLKNTLKAKNGNVAEINLLLTVMLRHEDIDADPVILSTRSNGTAYSLYPILSQYNYVICRSVIDGKEELLDATEPHMGFDHLPLRCFNGDGRVVNEKADLIVLNPDSLKEVKSTMVFLINDEKGKLVGSFQQTPGYYESDDQRDIIKEKGIEELKKSFMKGFGTEINVSNFAVDSVNNYDEPLGIHFDFDLVDEKPEIIYMNPLFGEGYKENPFKSAERLYPVEMPFSQDETFNLQLEVPQGYVVDELPTSILVKLNDRGDGMFEYRISQSGDNISLRSRIRFTRSYFMPDEYETLREFFNLIVKKQAEQIVFKKKK